jgi:PAS domain S-box-containing protein
VEYHNSKGDIKKMDDKDNIKKKGQESIEDELRNSEARYRTLYDNSPASITLVDMNGIIIDCNFATEKLIGYSKEEIIGKPFEQLLTLNIEDLPKLRERFGMLLQGEAGTPYELEIIRKDDQIRWIRVLNSLLFKNSDIVGIQVISEDITDEKKAQEAVRESEEMFRSAFDYATIGRAMVEPTGKFIDVNTSFCQTIGYNGEELLKKTWMEITHPDDLKESAEYVRQLMEGERSSMRYIHRLIHKNGHIVWVDLNVVLIRDRSGNPLYMVGDIVDITEHKKAEEALINSEEKYRSLVEEINEVIFSVNDKGIITYMSPAVETLTGYPTSEIIGQPFFKFIYKEDIDRAKEGFIQTLSGQVHPNEYRGIRKSGEIFWIQSFSKPIIENKKVMGARGVLTDITDRKVARQALLESEQKHRTLFETMTQGVVYQDVDGNIISANPAAEEILGLTVEQMMGRSSMDHQWKSIREDGSDFPGDTHPSMVALRIGEEVRNVVMGIFHPDKERHVWININAVPQFKPQESKPYQVYTTFEDITERIETEENIKESLHEKELLLKEIHHRVKNNLQVISSMLSLQSMHIMDDDLKAMFRESQGRVQTMAIVHEKMYQSPDLSKIGFADYLKDLTHELFASYGVDSSQITSDVNVADIKLGVDVAIPCGLIVNELISNSLKHAFPNGEKGEIKVHLIKDSEDKFNLVVGDNGVGFPKGIDFKQMESLGLRLVNTLVDQLKGTIELENEGGTKFKIEFTAPGKLKGLRE